MKHKTLLFIVVIIEVFFVVTAVCTGYVFCTDGPLQLGNLTFTEQVVCDANGFALLMFGITKIPDMDRNFLSAVVQAGMIFLAIGYGLKMCFSFTMGL